MESYENNSSAQEISNIKAEIVRLEEQLKSEQERLDTAMNTPESPLFTAEQKRAAIKEFEEVVENSKINLENYNKQLAALESQE